MNGIGKDGGGRARLFVSLSPPSAGLRFGVGLRERRGVFTVTSVSSSEVLDRWSLREISSVGRSPQPFVARSRVPCDAGMSGTARGALFS